MPNTPSLEYGGPAVSFSPYGEKNGAKIANSTTRTVTLKPNANRFCLSARRKKPAGAGTRRGLAHEEIAVLARGVSRIESTSATRFTTM